MQEKKTITRIGSIWIVIFLAGLAAANLSYGEEVLPTFGQGEIQVILYTDYFCPPCRSMEPDVEPILKDLMKTGKINLTFVDTPTKSTYFSLCPVFRLRSKH